MYVCMYASMYACMHVCMYVRMCIVCIMQIHICMIIYHLRPSHFQSEDRPTGWWAFDRAWELGNLTARALRELEGGGVSDFL